MQDIRRFLSLTSAKGSSSSPGRAPAKNGKNGSRKRAIIDSDSDEEAPVRTPNKKPARSPQKSAKKAEAKQISKYFEVNKSNVKSLFGTDPVKQVLAPKQPEKSVVDESELAIDAAFMDMDDCWSEMNKSPVKPAASDTESPTARKVENGKKHHTISPEVSPIREKAKVRVVTPKKPHHFSPKLKNSDPVGKSPPGAKRPKDGSVFEKHIVRTPPKNIVAHREALPSVISSSSSNASDLSSPEFENRLLKNGIISSSDSQLSTGSSSDSGYRSQSAEPSKKKPIFELWVDKYKPTSLRQIIGQQGDKSNVAKLTKWLRAWNENQSGKKKIPRPSPWAKDDSGAYFKAALLSGPPGVGKTTAAHLVCRELGFDLVEFNASDTRSKKLLHQEITELLTSESLNSYAKGGSVTSKRHVLIMDEVDGMAGNEDRGGIQELISLIKNTKIPVICMCNDRNHPKIRSLVNYCFDLRFHKPKADQIKGAMLSICFKEGIKIRPDVLANIIASTNQDIRLVLNHLSMLAAKKDAEMTVSTKEIKLGAWDVLRQVFSETEHKSMSIHDQMDLFFHDYSIAPLFVQENYLTVVPHSEESKTKKGKMKLFAEAASALCHGDLVDRTIRSQNAWSLLPTQALFSSFVPGQLLEGHVGGMINFPAWLGKNSKKNKMDRLAQEVQSHTRLRASASVESVKMDYSRALRDALLNPLVHRGSSGVEDSLAIMREYSLLREDLDSINELSLWPGFKDPMTQIDSKVKAAFTRSYNKNPVMTPFSISSAAFKKARGGSKDDDLLDEQFQNEEGDAVVDDEENEEDDTDPVNDAMITAKKARNETSKEAKAKKDPANAKQTSRGRKRTGAKR